MATIKWTPKFVKLDTLTENPNNPKTDNDRGKKRLTKLLEKFGLAGSLVANKDGQLIDGHKRRRKMMDAGIKEAWVSFPSRKLLPEEYDELNAMYDLAKAGDPDIPAIEKIITEKAFEDYLFEPEIASNTETTTFQVQKSFKIIVQLTTAAHQKTLFELLQKQGYNCKMK